MKKEQGANGCTNETSTCTESDAKTTQARSGDVPKGFTYFVRNGDEIKIGFSAAPIRRIKSHKRKFPDLKVLAVVSSTVAGEFETHQRFDHLRIRDDEWFHADPELFDFIEGLKDHHLSLEFEWPSAKVEQSKPQRTPKPLDPWGQLRGALIKRRPKERDNPALHHRVNIVVSLIDHLKREDGDPIEIKRRLERTMAEISALAA